MILSALARRPCGICTIGLVIVLFCSMGCGAKKNTPRAPITGKVTFGAKSLGAGIITFVPDENPNATGVAYIRTDGTYESKGVPIGKCKVTVKTSHLNPVQPPPKPGDPKPQPPEFYVQQSGDPKTGKVYIPIPLKYEKVESTTLTFDVQAGDNTYEIKLDEK